MSGIKILIFAIGAFVVILSCKIRVMENSSLASAVGTYAFASFQCLGGIMEAWFHTENGDPGVKKNLFGYISSDICLQVKESGINVLNIYLAPRILYLCSRSGQLTAWSIQPSGNADQISEIADYRTIAACMEKMLDVNG
jgi:hypothetical protein